MACQGCAECQDWPGGVKQGAATPVAIVCGGGGATPGGSQLENLCLQPLCDPDTGEVVGYVSTVAVNQTTVETFYFDTNGQEIASQPAGSVICNTEANVELETGCLSSPASVDLGGVERCPVIRIKINGTEYPINLPEGWLVSDLVAAVDAIDPNLLDLDGSSVVLQPNVSIGTIEIICDFADFTENFGVGGQDGARFSTPNTTYVFSPAGFHANGEYSITSFQDVGLANYSNNDGNITADSQGDVNGNAIIVNASFGAGEFYRQVINGLITGQEYSVSFWAIDTTTATINPTIRPNIRIDLEDLNAGNAIVATAQTGDIQRTDDGVWIQYVFDFVAPSPDVEFVLVNNAAGGTGNDLAIDQIQFNRVTRTLLTMLPQGELIPVEIVKILTDSGGIESVRVFSADGQTEYPLPDPEGRVLSVGPCITTGGDDPCQTLTANGKVCYSANLDNAWNPIAPGTYEALFNVGGEVHTIQVQFPLDATLILGENEFNPELNNPHPPALLVNQTQHSPFQVSFFTPTLTTGRLELSFGDIDIGESIVWSTPESSNTGPQSFGITTYVWNDASTISYPLVGTFTGNAWFVLAQFQAQLNNGLEREAFIFHDCGRQPSYIDCLTGEAVLDPVIVECPKPVIPQILCHPEVTLSEALVNGDFSNGLNNWSLTGNAALGAGGVVFNGSNQPGTGVLTQTYNGILGSNATLTWNFIQSGGGAARTQVFDVNVIDTVTAAVIVTQQYLLNGSAGNPAFGLQTLQFVETGNPLRVEFIDSTAVIDSVDFDVIIDNVSVIHEDGAIQIPFLRSYDSSGSYTDTDFEGQPYTPTNEAFPCNQGTLEFFHYDVNNTLWTSAQIPLGYELLSISYVVLVNAVDNSIGDVNANLISNLPVGLSATIGNGQDKLIGPPIIDAGTGGRIYITVTARGI